MSVINTNYLALVSQNNLTKSQNALGTAIERLSSGMRINSAKDDAAGQAIANRFTANIKGLTQASRNANDGISIAQTTEGSLNEINNNLQRIRELSVQAANGSNSQTDLDSIQAEIRERLDEIDRVSAETQFNGKYVLGKDADEVLSVQVGAHDNQRIDIKLSRIDSNTLNLGSYNVNSLSAGDLSDSLTAVTTQTSTDVSIGSNAANPNPIGPVMEADGVYKATLTTTAVITPAVEFQGATAALTDAEVIDAAIDPSADAKIVSYDDGAGNTLYAAVDDPTNITKAVQVTIDPADGTFQAGAALMAGGDLTTLQGATVTVVDDGDEYQAAVTGDVEVDGYAVKGEDGNYYALTHNEATDKWVWDSSTTALDVSKVDVVGGAVEELPVFKAFEAGTFDDTNDVSDGGTNPNLTIDYSAGLFARNDVINDPSSGTALYAVKGDDGNYYQIEATFTFNGAVGEEGDASKYDVAYAINTDPDQLVQVSAGNIGDAVTDLAVGTQTISATDDLLNQDIAGLTGDGLYALADGSGYVVKGTDGNYYEGTLDEDTGNVTWNSNDQVDAADVDVDRGAIPAIDGAALEGSYTDLADGETLHSYTDADGDTHYVVKSGAGGDVTYTRATLGDADPATGDVAVIKATGDDATMDVRTTDPLAALDAALQQVDDLRSHLGAIQNRFESTIANLNNTVNNLSAARSRIEDADYAVEVSNMTRAQILQQAGTSVLAQANQIPQTVLSLLR